MTKWDTPRVIGLDVILLTQWDSWVSKWVPVWLPVSYTPFIYLFVRVMWYWIILFQGNNFHSIDSISWWSCFCSAGIFATTIQAQDFKDTVGDKLIGRKTLPIVYPDIARPTLMLSLAIWSIGLSLLWQLSAQTALAFNILGMAVGGRFISKTNCKADQRSFYLYNVRKREFRRKLHRLNFCFRSGSLSHIHFRHTSVSLPLRSLKE